MASFEAIFILLAGMQELPGSVGCDGCCDFAGCVVLQRGLLFFAVQIPLLILQAGRPHSPLCWP
jgi:hypothetical protein